MKMPFTPQQFIQVFRSYNEAIFPWQAFHYLIGILIIFLLFQKTKWSSRSIAYLLAFLWAWMGMVYHITFFTLINKAAYLFGVFFVIQAVLMILSYHLKFRVRYDLYGLLGSSLIIYSLVIYPAIGMAIGHVYPSSPTFGLPCPTTIFTFGVLLVSEPRVPVRVIIIPLLWAVIGTFAAINLGYYEDFGLLLAAIIFLVMFLKKGKHPKVESR